MSTAKFIEVHVGDVVRLRKPHACGGLDWTIVRLGADIGLRCDHCQHRILLARSVFERRLKAFLSHAVLPIVDDPRASLPTPSASPSDPGVAQTPPSASIDSGAGDTPC